MDAIPTVMRAIDPEQPGGPEVLRIVERPVPTPGEGEVLIRVALSSDAMRDFTIRPSGRVDR